MFLNVEMFTLSFVRTFFLGVLLFFPYIIVYMHFSFPETALSGHKNCDVGGSKTVLNNLMNR